MSAFVVIADKLASDFPQPSVRQVVSVAGVDSTKVAWMSREWLVTDLGLSDLDDHIFIAAKRLWEDEGSFGWVAQVAEKEGYDLTDFCVALAVARAFHNEKYNVG